MRLQWPTWSALRQNLEQCQRCFRNNPQPGGSQVAQGGYLS
jgi:hypothetical protein